MTIIAGTLVENDGKYLLMQEAREDIRGLWNLPAGHVDANELIQDAAVRETLEETGYNVELTGICQIVDRKVEDDTFVVIIFTAKLKDKSAQEVDPAEIMDVKWLSYDEILTKDKEIRNRTLMFGALENARNGIVAPMKLIDIYGSKD